MKDERKIRTEFTDGDATIVVIAGALLFVCFLLLAQAIAEKLL